MKISPRLVAFRVPSEKNLRLMLLDCEDLDVKAKFFQDLVHSSLIIINLVGWGFYFKKNRLLVAGSIEQHVRPTITQDLVAPGFGQCDGCEFAGDGAVMPWVWASV
jgi:hypothetical protein